MAGDGAPLANVIRLPRVHAGPGGLERARRDAEQARQFLEARYGSRWTELPTDLGRAALHAEQLLATGPTALQSEVVQPADAIAVGRTIALAGATVAGLLEEETDILGEVLGTSLRAMPLRRLTLLARAMVELGTAPAPDPAWGDPRAAEAAEVVLAAHGARLLESREQHERVYRWFTERVWEIPERWLDAGRHPWHVVRCVRLVRALRAVSREGRRQPLRHSVDLLRSARKVRAELETVAPLLARHLGMYDRGALTDVPRAAAAISAIRELHDALGAVASPERISSLLAAQAFSASEVTGPANTILTVITAWETDLDRVGARGGISVTVSELDSWAHETSAALRALHAGLVAVEQQGVRPVTLRELVNDLLARQRIDEIDPHLASHTPRAAGAGADALPATLAEALPPLDPDALRSLTTDHHGAIS